MPLRKWSWTAVVLSSHFLCGPCPPAIGSLCLLCPLLPHQARSDPDSDTTLTLACTPSIHHQSLLILGTNSRETIPLAGDQSIDWFLLVRHLPLESSAVLVGGVGGVMSHGENLTFKKYSVWGGS